MNANAITENEGSLDWAGHEAEIRDLYLGQKWNLPNVRRHMKEKYGFDATERQYKFRFGGRKNVTSDEWDFVGRERQRRAALGKETIVCFRGEPLPAERVDRGIARSRKHGSGPNDRVNKRKPTLRGQTQAAVRSRITFRTPPSQPNHLFTSIHNQPHGQINADLLSRVGDDSSPRPAIVAASFDDIEMIPCGAISMSLDANLSV
ncbi:uncharacterized protein B0H64DRAFT_403502 [Chaetomium fimeti]|uniref:Clr5 domain-containing protein n=1 Tax=Chaetomium fimeti TaxID=1854472 RepID=A0AAE0HAY1_9PEZI|nr:hypothetical protein B0H64DRAFT_403502 [Chaetomium fimeti]